MGSDGRAGEGLFHPVDEIRAGVEKEAAERRSAPTGGLEAVGARLGPGPPRGGAAGSGAPQAGGPAGRPASRPPRGRRAGGRRRRQRGGAPLPRDPAAPPFSPPTSPLLSAAE